MASPAAQDFKSHRRYDPMWHFVGVMIVAAGFITAIIHAIRHPENGYWNWWFVVYTFGLLACVARARAQTLVVQNRVIRLEMRLRVASVAPALASRFDQLTVSQIVGLRFAGDAELPGLIERCLNGQLANGEAVKKEIKNWQPDWLRA